MSDKDTHKFTDLCEPKSGENLAVVAVDLWVQVCQHSCFDRNLFAFPEGRRATAACDTSLLSKGRGPDCSAQLTCCTRWQCDGLKSKLPARAAQASCRLPSQVVSEFLRDFEFGGGRLDGVAYNSVVDPRTWNVALLAEASDLRGEQEPRCESRWSKPPTPWLQFVRAIRT